MTCAVSLGYRLMTSSVSKCLRSPDMLPPPYYWTPVVAEIIIRAEKTFSSTACSKLVPVREAEIRVPADDDVIEHFDSHQLSRLF